MVYIFFQKIYLTIIRYLYVDEKFSKVVKNPAVLYHPYY